MLIGASLLPIHIIDDPNSAKLRQLTANQAQAVCSANFLR